MWWASIPKNMKIKASFLLLILGLLFGSSSLLLFIFNPLDLLIEKVLEIKPNSFAFELWKNPPYEVMIKAYIFNVTNGRAFLDGEEKLVLNEVGPYVYKEMVFNTNISFNENGTLSFIGRRAIKLVPGLSVGDPSKDTLLLPNVPLLGAVSAMVDQSFFVKLAVGQLSLLVSAKEFLNLTVDEYLFGYNDNLITLASQFLPNWIDFSRFGIADRIIALDNASNIASTVLQPEKFADIGKYSLIEFRGSPHLEEWSNIGHNSTCGLIKGAYLNMIFPPNLPEGCNLVLYRSGFCRPIPIRYNHTDTKKYGYKTYTFTINDNFLATDDPDNHCYCRKWPCIRKGVGDISPCYYGIPLTISQPHFLNADPKLLQEIGGLSPDPQKHSFYIVIHPESGLTLEAKFRLQLNLNVPNTSFNYRTRPFNDLVLPLLWFELSIDGPPTIIKIAIQLLYVILPTVQNIFKVIFALLGIASPMVAAWIYFSEAHSERKYHKLNVVQGNGIGKIVSKG
ncbi:hypothetical protein RI129_012620 [Pyrocoelia pectoralis]|uniref:Scavenger receptor class B member 1 n=1 Tax=Pyrocoelia pectoralis TaxID=417401 RepID=A0AAN7UTV0_9COLE